MTITNAVSNKNPYTDWYTLQSKFGNTYTPKKVEQTQEPQGIGGITPVTESYSGSVNIKPPTYASGLAYEGVYQNQAGREGIVGGKFDTNKLWQ